MKQTIGFPQRTSWSKHEVTFCYTSFDTVADIKLNKFIDIDQHWLSLPKHIIFAFLGFGSELQLLSFNSQPTKLILDKRFEISFPANMPMI